jgi:hypothetical protein
LRFEFVRKILGNFLRSVADGAIFQVLSLVDDKTNIDEINKT